MSMIDTTPSPGGAAATCVAFQAVYFSIACLEDVQQFIMI